MNFRQPTLVVLLKEITIKISKSQLVKLIFIYVIFITMIPKYIDIHSHLNLEQFEADRDEVIRKMKDEEVGTITVGTGYETSLLAIEISKKEDFLYASVGLHPSDVDEEFNYEKMFELARDKKVVAIGECGLDYFRDGREEVKIKQKELFESHVKLAIEVSKPLMIHARATKGTMDAYHDVLDILEEHRKDDPKLHANFHFFAGDKEVTSRIISLGFSMSFDGPITFSSDYDEVIKMIPIDLIMAETDSPFAAPAPYRGKRCEPWMVKEVVKRIAEIKELPQEEVVLSIQDNMKRIFDI